MNTTIGCPIPGESQPKEPVRLIDANSILRSIDVNGSAYDGIEYQAYKAGAEYVRSMIEDAPIIDPESLRPTAKWENEDDYYGDSIIWCCSVCKDRFILNDGTPEENNYKYCPSCGARMVSADERKEKENATD